MHDGSTHQINDTVEQMIHRIQSTVSFLKKILIHLLLPEEALLLVPPVGNFLNYKPFCCKKILHHDNTFSADFTSVSLFVPFFFHVCIFKIYMDILATMYL